MLKVLRTSFAMLVMMTALTGLAYPLLVTALAQLFFPRAANGSLIERDGIIVGSALIGQNFTDPRYFWGRPSSTAPFANNASASGGSNLGPTNPALTDSVAQRIAALREADPSATGRVPVDLVTASGSGLDPHISPAAAEFQVARVARARALSPADVRALIEAATQGRTFGVLGEPRVNVLVLNLALDARQRASAPSR